MRRFNEFLIEQSKEQMKNINITLSRLPKKHRDLIYGYDIKWQCDNVLQGDDGHVGMIDSNSRTITIAAPYRYSREHTFLHELAHIVWQILILPNQELVNRWKEIIKHTKNKLHQNAEELFCHGYAAAYSQIPPTIHHHQKWIDFIKSL